MLEAYQNFLRAQEQGSNYRRVRVCEPSQSPGRIILAGRELVNFSSNDYLGLSRHPELARRACAFAEKWGSGATASRLVCGGLPPHETVERKLAQGKGSQAALLLGAGYQANSSLLPALFDRTVLGHEPLVYSDRLNHASIHAGCRAAGVRQIRYRHLDLNHLQALLEKQAGQKAARFIVSESVFSMDGDRADVAALAGLAEKYGAFLYLDEAHAAGVLGEKGFGLAAGLNIERGLVMGTFSKALGSYGSYVACTSQLREYLVNRCAGFIFSTALPPPLLGAMDAALDLLPELDEPRRRLLEASDYLRREFQRHGLDTSASSTQIIPGLVGQADLALGFSAALENEGFLAVAIRPPTVPEGASRIRISLSAAHSGDDIERLAETLPRLARQAGLCP